MEPTEKIEVEQRELPSERSMGIAARCWCEPTTETRVTDVELAIEFAKVLDREYENFEREMWGHAGCLSIAEGCPGWDSDDSGWSAAMTAVRDLRKKSENYKRALKNLLGALSDDAPAMEFAIKQA